MDLNFRKLRADEIELRLSERLELNGIRILAYKNARCDQNILDEEVGPLRWKREHSRNNNNCIVSIYDPDIKEWVSKEDCGSTNFFGPDKEKSIASDSFKRACTNWGIGRELYTVSRLNLFVDPSEIKCTALEKNGELYYKCADLFKVLELEYSEDESAIISMTISVTSVGQTSPYLIKKFPVTEHPVERVTQVNEVATNIHIQPQQVQNIPKEELNNDPLDENEIILMGNCRNRRFGDVKDTDAWRAFLSWAKGQKISSYDNDEKAGIQFRAIKKWMEKS